MYKVSLKKDGTVFLGKSINELAHNVGVTHQAVQKWIDGKKSPSYNFKKLTTEEYEKEVNKQRKIKASQNIILSAPKQNNELIFNTIKQLTQERINALNIVREKYKNTPQKMKLALIAKKQEFAVRIYTQLPQSKFVWNSTNNSYKQVPKNQI